MVTNIIVRKIDSAELTLQTDETNNSWKQTWKYYPLLEQLYDNKAAEYFLLKATIYLNKRINHASPFGKDSDSWAMDYTRKAKLFSSYLAKTSSHIADKQQLLDG